MILAIARTFNLFCITAVVLEALDAAADHDIRACIRPFMATFLLVCVRVLLLADRRV